MISSVIADINSSIISSVVSSANNSPPDIDSGNLLFSENNLISNELYQDNDGLGQALLEETI